MNESIRMSFPDCVTRGSNSRVQNVEYEMMPSHGGTKHKYRMNELDELEAREGQRK